MKVFLLIIGFLIFIWMVFNYVPLGYYFALKKAGVRISLLDLIRMRFRKTSVPVVIKNLARIEKAGLDIRRAEIEELYLQGRDVDNIVSGMIASRKNGFGLTLEQAILEDKKGVKFNVD